VTYAEMSVILIYEYVYRLIGKGPFKKLIDFLFMRQDTKYKFSYETKTIMTLTPTMPNTVVATTTEVATNKVVPKSLPMKPKTMQCGIVGFLKKMELEGVLEGSVCETLLTKLPLFGTVEEQVSYYDTNYDLKHIEQTYIKPRVQEHKKANKPQKEKKPRQKKAKVETKPEENVVPTTTPEKVNDVKEPEKPVKKPRVKKADGEKKPRGRKAKETEVEFARDEDEEKPVVKDLTIDLEAEAYVKTATAAPAPKKETKMEKAKEEKPKKKRAAPKKKAEEKPKEEVEYWLFMRNNVRYWTTSEDEKNGDVYSYDGKDEDGDPAPNKKVGRLVDGELQLD
jgi:hypothetical protein